MDRFLETIVSTRIYQDTQIFVGRKNGKPNLSRKSTVPFGHASRGIPLRTCGTPVSTPGANGAVRFAILVV